MKKPLILTMVALFAVSATTACSFLDDIEGEDGRLAFGRLVKEPPNTQKLDRLPDIDTLIDVSRSLATLDCIYRENLQTDRDADVKFIEHYQDRDGEKVLQLEWEGNDSLVVWFSPGGCVIKGHDDESVMNPVVTPFDLEDQEGIKLYPGLLKGFPKELRKFLNEPNFNSENATFVIWRKADDTAWHIGPINWPNRAPNRWKSHDGSDDLLSPLSIDAKAYAGWLRKSKKRKVAVADIEKVFAQEPMTEDLLKRLDSHRKLSQIKDELKKIGYPLAE